MKQKFVAPFEFKLREAEPGTFSGIANRAGIIDLVGDRTVPGAFSKDLKERGAKRPLLWMHDPHHPVGSIFLDTNEDGSLVVTKGKLVLDVQKAAEAYALLKAGAINGLSIGYEVKNSRWVRGVRELTEVAILEVSLVTFPANSESTVESVKQLEELRTVREALVSLQNITDEMKTLITLQETQRHIADVKAMLRRSEPTIGETLRSLVQNVESTKETLKRRSD